MAERTLKEVAEAVEKRLRSIGKDIKKNPKIDKITNLGVVRLSYAYLEKIVDDDACLDKIAAEINIETKRPYTGASLRTDLNKVKNELAESAKAQKQQKRTGGNTTQSVPTAATSPSPPNDADQSKKSTEVQAASKDTGAPVADEDALETKPNPTTFNPKRPT